MIWLQVFLKENSALVGTGCFDQVILAELIISDPNLWQTLIRFFNHSLTDLIFFLLFCFLILFQDNPKLVEAQFFRLSLMLHF